MKSENPSQRQKESDGTDRQAEEHGNKAQPPIPPSSTSGVSKVQPPPSPHSYAITCDKKRDVWDWVKFAAEIVGIGVVIVYTTIAALQWCEMKKANTTAQESLQAQTRPWIGIEGNKVAPVASPEYAWSPALPYPTVWVTLSYSIKNYGTGPGFRQREWFKVIPVSDVGGYSPTFPDECAMAETHQPASDKAEMGYVIFTGASITTGSGTNLMVDMTKTKNLRRVWIAMCIAYQDSSHAQWHHSRYRYISQPMTGQPVTFPSHPGWSYVPFSGFSLDSASAD